MKNPKIIDRIRRLIYVGLHGLAGGARWKSTLGACSGSCGLSP